jgi:hypothetical protein
MSVEAQGTAGGPFFDEETYAQMVDLIVHESAPSRFAIVQDYKERVDGCVAAYGIATTEGATIVSEDAILSVNSAESGARRYARPPHVTARVVWIDPEPSPDEFELGAAQPFDE